LILYEAICKLGQSQGLMVHFSLYFNAYPLNRTFANF
jgi:hypothetical protein